VSDTERLKQFTISPSDPDLQKEESLVQVRGELKKAHTDIIALQNRLARLIDESMITRRQAYNEGYVDALREVQVEILSNPGSTLEKILDSVLSRQNANRKQLKEAS